MSGFKGNTADLLDDSLPSEVLRRTLETSVNGKFNKAAKPSARSRSRSSQNDDDDGNSVDGHSIVRGARTEDAACQTEVLDDLSFLPSANDAHVQKDFGVRGADGKEKILERKSLFGLLNNKVHPEEELQLDSPRRLQARANMRRKLGFFGLLLFDLKKWIDLQRTQRRDPVPIWRSAIKRIEGRFGSSNASFFVFLRWLFLLNCIMAAIWLALVVLPNVVTFDYGFYITYGFSVDQLLSGRGAVGQSWMFYGSYPAKAGSYRMDMAYIAVIIIVLVGCAVFIVHTMVMALSPVHSRGTLVNMDKKTPYSIFTFSSWDHAINDAEAVQTLKNGIVNAIRDHLQEEMTRKQTERIQQSTYDLWKLRLLRSGMWLVWACLVTGSFLAIWYIIQSQSVGTTGIGAYSSVIVFALINAIVPMIISALTKLEHYPGQTEMRTIIGRSAVLRILVFYAVLYGLYNKTEMLSTQYPIYNATVLTPTDNCAGAVYGQELYRLVLIDSLVSAVAVVAFHLVMYHIWHKRKEKLELDIPDGVLALIFRQGFIWVGMAFCPVLPVLGALSFCLMFYIYYQMVKRTCRPPNKRWTQNRHNVFFFVFLLVMLVVAIIPLNIALQGYKPNCGPYGDAKYSSMYGAVDSWLQEQNSSTRTFAAIITNPAFIFPLLVALCGVIYYHRVRIHQWQHHHLDLLHELDQLRADKKCLLARGPVAPRKPNLDDLDV